MAKRVSSEGVNVEYVDDANRMVLAAIGTNIEYVDDFNRMILASIGIMVEYVLSTGRTQGPAAQ